MANRLGMLKSQGIKALGEAGRSEREIAQVMGVSRGAVRRHLGREEANRTKAPTGEAPTGSEEPNGTKAPTGSIPDSESGSDKSRSRCEGLRDQVLEKLDRGLTAIRIHQDLRSEHGFTEAYSSVRRYVRQLKARSEVPFRRMETAPGFEMQFDYGTGATCRDTAGNTVKTHVFRVVLSHSRKGYSEAVRTLATESFLRLGKKCQD